MTHRMPDSAAVLVVSDRGRVLRLPLAEVLYLKAELKYVTLRTAHQPTCSTTRWPTWNSAWAKASCASIATRWWRSRPCVRWSVASCDSADSGRGEAAAETWAVRWHPSTSGWRCRAVSWRRCARRCVAEPRRCVGHEPSTLADRAPGRSRSHARAHQPVLRSPAAMPLIDRWMPRRSRCSVGSAASAPGRRWRRISSTCRWFSGSR